MHCLAALRVVLSSCLGVVGDRVYDVTGWLADHPGRAAPILKLAGQDATAAFWKFHAKEILVGHAMRFDIGAIAGGALETPREESGRVGRDTHVRHALQL